ncbi:glycosyltransferase family 4 protein [Lusitaniella coriacea]|uniref:glycosyltransferase family 4 protein n=1 Tax=Lusitaniella coriacea TaxID=1983105 RepID=UPI003CF9422C
MNNPRFLLVHPTGNPFARNAAIALAEKGILEEIVTAIAYNPEGNLARTLQRLPDKIARPLARELGRRTWIAPPGASLHTYPLREVVRIALVRWGVNSQKWVDWVYAGLDRRVARNLSSKDNEITGVYAYEDGAAETFAIAKDKGLFCGYDLPIVFYRQSHQIQAEEAERFPALAPALQAAREPQWKIERKEREIQLADWIVVPSSVVKQSLLDAGIPSEKISTIPFGSPQEYFHPQPKQDSRFRALFVGRLGPRKGVHYLLQAWQTLKFPDAELLCVGMNEFPSDWLTPYEDCFRHIPSIPHASLNPYYSSASVFVFPSLVEGLALVLLEAMACGIPIITTANAGGTDIITDGVEGFIIPIRDADAIAQKLEWCYTHPQELAQMGQAARRKAEVLTWSLYRERLATKLTSLLE